MAKFLLMLALVFTAAPVRAQVGSTDVPKELPAGIKDWNEFVGCDQIPPCVIGYDNAQVQYDLYTQPGRAGLYTISHYLVRPTKTTGMFAGAGTGYRAREVIVWLEFLGRGYVPQFNQHVFIKRGRRAWYTAGLVKRWRWEEIPTNSPEGRFETAVVNRLWRLRADVLMTNEASSQKVRTEMLTF